MTLREILVSFLLFCAVPAFAVTPQENWNVVLTPVASGLHDSAGLDHHQPNRKLLVSASAGANSFALLAADGSRAAFSNVAGLQGDVLVATARNDGQGVSRGGFQPGTVFATTGAAGAIARISADGASVQDPWAVLPDEAQITGLHVDRTGAFGGDLVAVTAAGGVWRVSASATPVRIAALGTTLAGVTVAPDDVLTYGPWAGKVLAGATAQARVYAVDAQGQSVSLAAGLSPRDLDIVPAHENLYAIDGANGKLLGAAEGALTGVIGDILITQQSPGRISRVRWDGTGFVITGLAEATALTQVAFSPAGAGAIPAVKQVYEKIAVVRHAPQLDSGRIEGTLWQLTGEDVLLDGTDTITSDLLVPGTPVVTAAASASYGGTVEGTESSAPAGYEVTIAGKASLRHVVTRTDAIALQEVAFPPAPQGTRDVQLRKAADSIGDPATLRHLDVAGNAGSVAVPPGTYGKFTISGRNTLVLGVEGAAEAAVYHLEELALTGGSSLRVAGPVVLRVRNAVTLVGSTVGAADDPKLLRLEVAHGRPADAVQVGGNGVLYAVVRAPQGKISIFGNGRLRGTVACDFLHVDGNGDLQITENDIPPPPVNRPPTANAGPDHTITLPIDTAAVEGAASDDGLPAGSAFTVRWTMVSGPAPVTFAAADSAATSATFSADGVYVLKLTASDGQLSSSDTVVVTVIPRNQPPVVVAGQEQTIELPAAAELHGTVTDDALPQGATLTVSWSMTDGPAAVTFADANAAATAATFSAPGVYTLRLSANDTEFTITDDVVVTVLKNEAPVVDAGEAQTIELPASAELHGTVTDDGLPTGAELTVTWTTADGPGAVTFADANAVATTATFSAPGVYTLRLSANDTEFTITDDVVVTVLKNEAPVVDAGEAQTIELPASAELHGTVTDDGLPTGAELTVTWTTADGPGAVTFADASAVATTATFSAPGVYTLRLSANDTEFTVTDDVVVTVLKNEAPVVDAGEAQTIALPASAELHGTVTDDGLPTGAELTVTWSVADGPGAVTFADASAVATTATFSAPGVYTLRLSANDTEFTITDDVVVTVLKNEAPSVDAGPAQTIELPASAELRGTATDDGLPQGSALTVTWELANGPGPVTFADAHAAVTTASFSAPGVYTLRLTASDSEITVSDDVIVTVLQNQAPAVNAGADQEITLPSNVLLRGTATDDGRPTGSTLEVFWTLVSGPMPVIFHDAFAVTTPVTITTAGTYVLRLTASDSQLSATDDLTIVVHPRPNQPPQITTDAIAEYLLGAVPTGGGETVDLSQWTVQNYTGSQPAASWQRDATNTVVTQTVNADPSIYVSDFNLSNAQMEGTWRVNTRDDDDYIGFVFGYQNDKHFYLFDWKQANQDAAARGMSLKVVSADTTLTDSDFWPTAGNARVKPLYHNSIGWSEFTDYQFTLQFHPGEIRIVVKQGATVLADFTVNDSTYTNGRFGFYNYSQAAVRYSGFRRLSLARGTYTYDVDAVDIDGDAITYSLSSAPLGMTIDPATGVITWPVSSAVAGNHPVAVRVQTPDGRFDVQSFTLTILSPNEAPVVNAGDDRLVATGTAAALDGTATDDGFPRNSTLGVSWSKVSGPGTVTFANASVAATNATFSQSGSYLLRLAATDSELSSSDEVMVTVNTAPVVNAGTDQTLASSNTTLLNGTVTDDGVPSVDTLSIVWSQVSGPAEATFDAAGAQSTRAIFPAPGTYTLRLTGNDSLHFTTDDVTVVVNASPELDGATLTLAAANGGPYATGSSQPLRATLRNASGNPLANYGVQFAVTGPNATSGIAVTDASGVATFTLTGANVGTDSIRAFVRTIEAPVLSITWTQAQASPPATQGWIGDPRSGSIVTGIVPITVGSGVTIAQGTVEYWPVSHPSAVTTLATNVQGGPDATLAALDTTTLANGNYIVRLRATDAAGQSLVSQVLLTVTGEHKPGRISFLITDFTVPVAGIPIHIARRYDSLERNRVGDFGYGWSLEVAGPRLEVSPDYDVTINEPGTGRRVTFQFAPTAFGFPFSFLYQPSYMAEPGVYGKLAANGCATLIRTATGVSCYLNSDPTYRPTAYTYTDPYGRVYTMTSAGAMQSIKDLSGNLLTFSATGITSSLGNLTVPFVRDAQNRITQITDPAGKAFRYDYDAAGDLTSVTLPDVSTPVTYTYEPGHFFSSSTDTRGNSQAASTYHPDGRLAMLTDAAGNTTKYDYDVAANRQFITYPDGGVETLTHDANGLLLAKTNPLGYTTTSTYDANRNKLTETNALQQTTTHTYDSRGNRTSTTDAAGRTQRWTYNQYGQPLTATDQLGKVRTIKYDAAFNMASVEDSLGIRTAGTYDSRGNVLTETDGNGRTTRFTYDAYGHVLTKTDPLGRVTTFTYDDMGRVLTVTDPRGGVAKSTYDALGRMLTLTDPLGHVTKYEYDGNSNKTAEVDANGKRTTYEYDTANRLTKVIHPDSTTLTYTYDFRDKRLTETDQDGHTTTYVYDKGGRQVKVINPDGTEVTFVYDANDRLIAKTDERNRTTRFEYDPGCGCSERLAKTIDAQGGVTSYGFDAAGRLISQKDANQRETRFEYDVRNLLTQVTYADDTTSKKTYDGAGQKLTETDQAGRVTRYTYDEAGNLLSVTDALNQTTVHTYDELGNVLSTTDALGRTTHFEYDALRRLTKRVLPLGMSELYTYDKVGNRITRTDFRGKQTIYGYDAMRRLVRVTPDPALGEPSVTVTYDDAGKRESMTDASGTTSYTYDERHRLLTKQAPQGTLTYTYDAAGQLATARSSNANGFSVAYDYDALDRLESVTDRGPTGGTTTYSYDATEHVLGITLPNGVQTAYTYDSVYRTAQMTHTRGATLASYAHTFDATGRRLSVTEHNGRSTTYTYDPLYRLTGETVSGDASASASGSVAYTYDSVANRLSRVSTMSAVSSISSAYDANDRLTTEAHDANGNTRATAGFTYTYDFEDRVRSVNGGAVRIVYDGDGNRASKTVGTNTTAYLVDELSPTGYPEVVEELSGGSVQRVYTYGDRQLSQRHRLNGAWKVSFSGHDAHGNVRFLTDEAGAVTDTYAYDAFGVLTSATGSTPNDYLFNGQQYDRDLGIYFQRARYYSQDRGRFLTMDRLGGMFDEPLTLHRYLFANGDPVNRIDPWGTSAMEEGIAAKMAVLRAEAVRCVGRATRTMIKEVAVELLVIYVIQKAGGSDPYVGRTDGDRKDSKGELLRFSEHERSKRFKGGLKEIGRFDVKIPFIKDPVKRMNVIRAIEQMVIDDFREETTLLNRRNEIDLKKTPNYREVFCK